MRLSEINTCISDDQCISICDSLQTTSNEGLKLTHDQTPWTNYAQLDAIDNKMHRSGSFNICAAL